MLRRPLYFIAVLTILMAAVGTHVRAALDASAPAASTGLEFLVLEVKSCHVCELVRTHILPPYERSTTARDAPMRFVDLNAIDEAKLGLTAPVTTVPDHRADARRPRGGAPDGLHRPADFPPGRAGNAGARRVGPHSPLQLR